MRNFGMLIGRILLAVMFLQTGISKLIDPAHTAASMIDHGISAPLVHPLLYLSAAIEIGCALGICLGLWERFCALLLFLWLIPVTFLYHGLPHQTIEVLKNVSMMGGFLIVLANGGGEFRLGSRREAATR